MEKSNKSSYTKSCHPELVSGSTPLVAIQNKEEMLKPFNETPYYNLTGLGPKVMASVQHDNVINGNNAYVEDPRVLRMAKPGMTSFLITATSMRGRCCIKYSMTALIDNDKQQHAWKIPCGPPSQVQA